MESQVPYLGETRNNDISPHGWLSYLLHCFRDSLRIGRVMESRDHSLGNIIPKFNAKFIVVLKDNAFLKTIRDFPQLV